MLKLLLAFHVFVQADTAVVLCNHNNNYELCYKVSYRTAIADSVLGVTYVNASPDSVKYLDPDKELIPHGRFNVQYRKRRYEL